MKTLCKRILAGAFCAMMLPLCSIAQESDIDWKQSLQASLTGATRLRIVSGRIYVEELEDGTRKEERHRLLFETEELSALDSLIQHIQINPEKSDGACMCGGDLIFEFYKGNKLATILSYHHGKSLRWSNGKWPCDGVLTDRSRTQVLDWLEDHGLPEPKREYEEDQRRIKEHQEEWARLRAVTPPSLVPFFAGDAKNRDFKQSDIQKMNAALTEQYPERNERILVLLEWYGASVDSSAWRYGSVAKKLLLLQPLEGIFESLQVAKLTPAQTEAAARYWAKEKDGPARKLMPIDLKALLIKHCLSSDSKWDRHNARNIFGEFKYLVRNEFIAITGYNGTGTTVDIPESIEELPVTMLGRNAYGNYAFDDRIIQITIPGSITNISQSVFDHCTNLETISVAPENPFYSSKDGLLLDKNQTTLIQCPIGKSEMLAIPESVTMIRAGAFADCGGLSQITFPDGVTIIGDGAFVACSNLTQIILPNSIIDIGNGAFSECCGLSQITIPAGVTIIRCRAFEYCTGLRQFTIPNSVTNIEVFAFEGCFSLAQVAIPKSVVSLAIPFGFCTNLKTISVDKANPNYSSADGILMDKSRTTLLQYPAGRTGAVSIPEGVKNIHWHSFDGCSGLTQITIPASVTKIRSDAFSYCRALKSVYFEGNSPEFEENVFDEDSKATLYYLPNTTGWSDQVSGRPAIMKRTSEQ